MKSEFSLRRFFTKSLFACALITLSLIPCSSLAEDNWPGWRGPDRNGIASEASAPIAWSNNEGIVWKKSLPGSGISNPIIWGNRVFVTSSDGPRNSELHVICLSRETGEFEWHQRFWGSAPTLYHQTKSSMASPSPVTDGKRLYAFFGTGDIFCLTLSGELLWQRSLAEEYGAFENRFAAASSPVLFEDELILQCDHYGLSYLLAIDTNTGENRWKSDRPECWLSWSSPQIVTANGDPELIVCGSEKADAYDPRSGEKLWTVNGLARECVATPVSAQGLVYLASGPKVSTLAVRLGGRGELSQDNVAWNQETASTFVPSAILVGDEYFLVDDKGIGSCHDAQTGELIWRKRIGGNFTASPVAAGDKVYFTDEAGMTTILKAGIREFKVIGKNSIDEPVYASAAIAGGNLFVRTAERLYCIGGK